MWSQIEATFKQTDTAATELECFQALQKQEVQAASYRVSSLVEEVSKQKGLERILQQHYGDLIAEHDRVQRLLEEHREHLRLEEEITAKQRALEEEITAKQLALEEEIAEKQKAHDEEIAAKKQLVEEESVAKSHGVDEEMADVCQKQDVLEAVNACNPDSGLNQAEFSVPAPLLNAESSNVEFTADQGQTIHSREMVSEGLEFPKEPTAIDTNAILAEDITGFGANGQMTVNSDGHQVEGAQPQARAGGFSTDAACNAGVLNEMMAVDSIQASELDASEVGNASNEMNNGLVVYPAAAAAAAATDSLNPDPALTEGVIVDSSDQVAVADLAGSGRNISDSSDRFLDGSANCMVTVEEHTAVNLTVDSELPDEGNVLASGTGEMESS